MMLRLDEQNTEKQYVSLQLGNLYGMYRIYYEMNENLEKYDYKQRKQ